MKTSIISYLLCIATFTAMSSANHGPNPDPNPGFLSRFSFAQTMIDKFVPKKEKAPEPTEGIPAKGEVIEGEVEKSPEKEVKVITLEEVKALKELQLKELTPDKVREWPSEQQKALTEDQKKYLSEDTLKAITA